MNEQRRIQGNIKNIARYVFGSGSLAQLAALLDARRKTGAD